MTNEKMSNDIWKNDLTSEGEIIMTKRPLSRTLRFATHPLTQAVLTIVFLLLTAHCSLLTVAAQSATATLSGTVQDQNGAAIPGVSLTVVNKGTQLKREATTNDEGSFTVPLLPPGQYIVRARRDGFAPIDFTDVVLNIGDQKALQIQLKAGDVNATVQVTSEPPLINESPAVATTIDRQFVGNMPLNGRSFESLITLTPGVVTVPAGTNVTGQFSVNGQRSSANGFTVDGVSANFAALPGGFGGLQTSGNLPGLTTLGTTQSLVSVDALEEFKVQTSSYAAEYGRQPGGQISIVTRSGGNEYHGSLFEYLRNDVLDANDWFANRAGQPRPKERQNDFGGTFSGPVSFLNFGDDGSSLDNGRNRTFFFFSYEGLRLQQPNFRLTNVPSLTLRQQAPAALHPLLNAFPLPNGRELVIPPGQPNAGQPNGLAEFSASYSDPSRLDATSIRLDHTVNRKLTLFGRYYNVPSENIRRGAGDLSMLTVGSLSTQGITVGATALLGRVSNELRVNYTNNGAYSAGKLDNFGGAVPPPRGSLIPGQFDPADAAVVLGFPGITSSPSPSIELADRAVTSQRQFNMIDNFSYARGSHQFKWGVDYRRLTPIGRLGLYNLLVRFQSREQVTAATAGFGGVSAAIPIEPVFVNFSAYGQDVWQPSRRLTLELGVRWEVNPAPSEAQGLKAVRLSQANDFSTMQVVLGRKAWTTTYNNFAPRFGIAYQLRQAPGLETVVRAGFGVFYDTGNDNSANPFLGFPNAGVIGVANITYPLSATQLAPPSLSIPLTPPYPFLSTFDPALKLPYTLQWNLALEQSLGKSQAVTVSYVGAAGRRLLQQTPFILSTINPNFGFLLLTRNQATSDYNALQAQFQRRLSNGLQVLASYTWSHALDEDSSSSSFSAAQRGNAEFDIRHVFAAAVTYDIPSPGRSSIVRAILGGWSADTSIHVQSALPIDIVAATIINPADGSLINVRPNVIPGVPIYLNGSQYPGGKIINNTVPTAAQIAAAGCDPNEAAKGAYCTPLAGQSGNLGRNQVRGLGAWQVDLAVRRQFKLREKVNLQFRAEAFNIFNHPNFGTVQTGLWAANFGEATNMLGRQLGGLNALYQIGGPRSLQFALKVGF